MIHPTIIGLIGADDLKLPVEGLTVRLHETVRTSFKSTFIRPIEDQNKTIPEKSSYDDDELLEVSPPIIEKPAFLDLLVQERRTQRFSVSHTLGRGSFGTVWSANDNEIGRAVALKQIKIPNTHFAEQLATEVKLLSKVQHPRIPIIYDIDFSDLHNPCIIMQHLYGDTLKAWIDRLREGDQEAHRVASFYQRADWIIQLCQVTAAAHAQGIIHRDIKPENIIISPSGELFLIDWGIAVEIDQQKENDIAGTPMYMSPEQAKGEQLDVRSDVFAISAVAYELFSLNPIRSLQGTIQEWLNQLISQEIKQIYQQSSPHQFVTPCPYQNLIMRGVELDREDRVASVAELLCQFKRAQEGRFDIVCPNTLITSLILKVGKYSMRGTSQYLLLYVLLSLTMISLAYSIYQVIF